MPTKETHFVNPYSFIRIPDSEPDRKAPSAERGELSGYIDCTLDIVSPTFIPNTTKKFEEPVTIQLRNGTRQDVHPHRVFYSYADLSGEEKLTEDIRQPVDPVIPGSELRGMIRNLYEQLTNSCFSQIDEFNLPYKRTPEPKVLCLMYWNEQERKWVLYPEQSMRRRTGDEADFGYARGVVLFRGNRPVFMQKRWDEVCSDRYEINEAYKEAYRFFNFGRDNRVSVQPDGTLRKDPNGRYFLHLPTKMNGKTQGRDRRDTANKMTLYAAKPNALAVSGKGYPITGDALTRFEQVLGLDEDVKGGYRDEGVNSNADSLRLSRNYAQRYLAHLPLVVYADKNSVDNEFRDDVTIYLSSSSMTKEFYGNKILDILAQNHQHQPCRNKGNACPACRLFGMIGEDGAVKGRLRFTDSHSCGPVRYGDEVTLDILATPHVSSTEFYLLPPADWNREGGSYPGLWNYDYALSYREWRDARGKRFTEFVRDKQSYRPVLAGRKVYWNHPFRYVSAPKTNMNATVTPITEGAFGFRVYFDSLTEQELKQLLFCLRLKDGETGSGATVHRIGGGKPLGLGQCRVTVNVIVSSGYVLRDGVITKAEEPLAVDCGEIGGMQAAGPILIASGSLPRNEETLVDYPRPVEGNEIFKWFGYNRGSVSTPKIEQTLPALTADSQVVEKNEQRSNRPGGGNQGGNRNNNGGSWNNNRGYGNGRNGNDSSRPATSPSQRRILSADTTGAKCLSCGKPVKTNPSTGKPFPLCQSCNNKKVSAECAVCGKTFVTQEYYAKNDPICSECRKKK